MSCKCFDEVLEKATKMIADQAPRHDPATLQGSWAHEVFVLGGLPKQRIALPIDFRYRRMTKENRRYAQDTKEQINIFMSFCPFCGKSMEDQDED